MTHFTIRKCKEDSYFLYSDNAFLYASSVNPCHPMQLPVGLRPHPQVPFFLPKIASKLLSNVSTGTLSGLCLLPLLMLISSCLAEETGLEPAQPFQVGGLANHCNTIMRLFLMYLLYSTNYVLSRIFGPLCWNRTNNFCFEDRDDIHFTNSS